MVESPFSAFGTALDDKSTAIIKLIAVLTLAGYVVVGGFWNGFYGHTLLTTGWDLSSNDTIMLHVLNTSCGIVGNLPNGYTSESLCQEGYSEIQSVVSLSNLFATVLPILLLIIAIVGLVYTTAPDSLGIIVAGLIFALILAFVLNQIGYLAGFGILGGMSTIPVHTTSTTSISTTSTSSTSTSTTTSSTTTTIKPTTECPTEANLNLPFNCSNPSIVTSNSISFYMVQTGGTPIYNVNLACITAPMQVSITANQFYPLQSDGMANLTRSNNGIALQSNQSIHIIAWPCNVKSNTNSSFEGYIWVRFTPNQSPPIANLNPWYSNRTFDIYINVTLPSSALNQTQ